MLWHEVCITGGVSGFLCAIKELFAKIQKENISRQRNPMKKIFLVILGIGILHGCTSPDQNQQIRQFWMKQTQNVQRWLFQKRMLAPKLPPELMSAAGLPTVSGGPSALGAVPVKGNARKQTTSAEPIPAKLFLSDTCGWCKKLKQSGFPEKFRNKYVGEVELTVYEVHSTQGNQEFAKAIKKYQLRGGVPLLIIGDSVISGYSDQMMALADEKVRLELKKRGTAPDVGPSMASIAMDDEEIQGPASAADKEKMRAYMVRVRENNEATLNSMRQMFSKSVWNQTLGYVMTTEEQIKKAANQSATYEEFVAKAHMLENTQQQQIDHLAKQNRAKIQ